MQIPWLPRAALLLATGAAVLAAEPPHVTVEWNPPKITRRQFDPRRPPAAMPKLSASESGVCHYEFTCDAGIGVFVDQKDARTVEVEIDTVDMKLDLPIDIWVMVNAPAKLAKHEEGHRQICEDYYRGCAAIARQLGQKMVGRKATGTGRSKQEAQDNAQQELLKELNHAYLNATRLHCRICQDLYDDITSHGRLPIGEAEAIAQAKAMEAAGKLPSTGMPPSDPVIGPGRL
jgi:hypothetical protein